MNGTLFLVCLLALLFKPYYGYYGQRLLKRRNQPRYQQYYDKEEELLKLERFNNRFNARYIAGDFDDYYQNEYDEFATPEVGDAIKFNFFKKDDPNHGFSHKTGIIEVVDNCIPKQYLIKIDGMSSTKLAAKETDFIVTQKRKVQKIQSKKNQNYEFRGMGGEFGLQRSEDIDSYNVCDQVEIIKNGEIGQIIDEPGRDRKFPIKMKKTQKVERLGSDAFKPYISKPVNYVTSGTCPNEPYKQAAEYKPPFIVPQTEPLWGFNVATTVWHSTSKTAADSIEQSGIMKPGKTGWVDGAIYFATTKFAARAKAYAAWLFKINGGQDDVVQNKNDITEALKMTQCVIKAMILAGNSARMTGKEAELKTWITKNGMNAKTPWKDALYLQKKDSILLINMGGSYHAYNGMPILQKQAMIKQLAMPEWVVYYPSRVKVLEKKCL